MLLCYDDEGAWAQVGEPALQAARQEAVALTHELDRNGQYILASPLQNATTATTVRVRNGKSVVTDGPFVETREVLGGFYLLDVDNLDDAIAIAARHPGARLGSVEIRPLYELAGLPKSAGFENSATLSREL
jgi:hypothetical protein